jgi:uncharacterized membrane protein
MNNDKEFKIWIVIILIIIIIGMILIYLRPQIIVNNYVSDGNYTFDIGQNMLQMMNKTVVGG